MSMQRRFSGDIPGVLTALLRHWLCLMLLTASGLTGAVPLQDLRFENIGMEQGLTQETVTAIVQDRKGFMWFGTPSGLARFDGFRTMAYHNQPHNPYSLADSFVRVLHVAPDGQLWIGSMGGLQRYDPSADHFIRHLPDEQQFGKGARVITAIADDGQGGLWLGSLEGLLHFNPKNGRFRQWRHQANANDSLSHDIVTSLAVDARGSLWVGSLAGVNELLADGEHFIRHDISANQPDAHKHKTIYRLLIDQKNVLWLASAAGLTAWQLHPGQAPTLHPFRQHAAGLGDSGGINALYLGNEGSAGSLWVGTAIGGLLRLDLATQRFQSYRHQSGDPYSLRDNNVVAIYQDRGGILWAGTWNAGVSYVDLDSGGFSRLILTHAPGAESSAHRSVSGITGSRGRDGEASDQWLWLSSSENGLLALNRSSGEQRIYRHQPKNKNSLSDDHVVTTLDDGQGRLWIGTKSGLDRLDLERRQFTHYRFPGNDAYSNAIISLFFDRKGQLWVGSYGGLHRFDPKTGQSTTWRHNPADPTSLANDVVQAIHEDRQGRLWIGTYLGLDLYDPASGRFQHFRHRPDQARSLAHDRVQSLFEDRMGKLWIGTAGGFSLLQAKNTGSGEQYEFDNFSSIDGLASDSVQSILEDDSGYLWLSTTAGISRWMPDTQTFRNYTARHGMVEGSYLPGAAYRAADGTLYFGGINGLTHFSPAAVHDNPHPPPVVLTDFQLFNQSLRGNKEVRGFTLPQAIEVTAEITLGPEHGVFTLEFAALHFAYAKSNRYAYKLEGFDREWSLTEASKRFATYTNLDPGVYTFRVRAANKDGVWNNEGASLRITIVPPYWKTHTFRAAMVLLMLAAIYTLYRLRVRRLTEQKARLEAQVAQRTAEVVRQKESLELAHHRLQDTQQQLIFQEKMASLGTLTAGVAHEINNPVNFTNAGAHLLSSELEEFRRFLFELAGNDAPPHLLAALDQRINTIRSHVGTISEGTARIRDIVRDLRTFSRLDEAEKKRVAVADSLLATVNLVRTRYTDSTTIHCDFAANPDLECWPAQLNQVFMNLIVNACQATQGIQRPAAANATPSIKPPGKLDIRTRIESGWLVIDFEDNGSGIPPAVQARIFEPFFTTKPVGEGTGLGLSISYGIIEKHGGTLSVRSIEGQGSCFTVRLPLQP